MVALFQVESYSNKKQVCLMAPDQISAIVAHAKSTLKKACANQLQHAGTHLRSAAFFNPKAAIILNAVAAQMITEISDHASNNNIPVDTALDQLLSAINDVPPPHTNLHWVLATLISDRLQQAREELAPQQQNILV
jgi:hypothetical protein